MKLTQTGVGQTINAAAIRESRGTSVLPFQVQVEGTATYRILGRVDGSAPWLELREPASEGFLEGFTWVPYVQLEVTSGDGTVHLWIGEA